MIIINFIKNDDKIKLKYIKFIIVYNIMLELFSKLFVIVGSLILFLLSIDCIYIIDEGHVGVYKKGGSLLNYLDEPGIYMKIPLLT